MKKQTEALMKGCCKNLSAAVLGLSLAGICLAQPTYTYTVIPAPGGTQSFRAWIADDGTIRGGSGLVDAGQGIQLRQCYTYKDGTWTVVPTPSTNCYFDNANKSGDFTGVLQFPGDQATHFFLYHNGGFQLLDALLPRTLAGPTFVAPTVMNDQGDIAGWIEIQEQKPMPPPPFAPPGAGPFYTGTIESYGFVYSGGQIRELPKLSNSPALTGLSTLGPFDFVYGANSKGDYVGYALLHEATTKDDPFIEHAVLWNHDGGVVDLGTVGGTWSEANAINASGQIVGKSSASDGEYDPTRHNIYHAFFYDNGSMAALPVPAIYSIATGINDQAEVVGYYYNAKSDGNVDFSAQHPFYWHRDGTADGKVVDLQTLVPSLPAETVLTGVDRLTSNGQIVVEAGQASAPGVTTMQLVLTPIQADAHSSTIARRHR
jgi:probable HAF family extracellular repeat protein